MNNLNGFSSTFFALQFCLSKSEHMHCGVISAELPLEWGAIKSLCNTLTSALLTFCLFAVPRRSKTAKYDDFCAVFAAAQARNLCTLTSGKRFKEIPKRFFRAIYLKHHPICRTTALYFAHQIGDSTFPASKKPQS
jgi:hypothetical protein